MRWISKRCRLYLNEDFFIALQIWLNKIDLPD